MRVYKVILQKSDIRCSESNRFCPAIMGRGSKTLTLSESEKVARAKATNIVCTGLIAGSKKYRVEFGRPTGNDYPQDCLCPKNAAF